MKSLGFYRLTPDGWGDETYLMMDEKKATAIVADSFDIPVEECSPDKNENDKPVTVELMQSGKKFFIRDLDKNPIRECANPGKCLDGLLTIYGKWEVEDD